MLNKIKHRIKKILYGYKASQEDYVKHLRKCGVKLGEHIEKFCPKDTTIDSLNPHLLEIGSYVSMTGPIVILTHDYSVCVLKKLNNGIILGKQRKTIIGNNIFLGWGCCVLPGAIIHDNTVIGAFSVVSGELEPNSVYAGNPAKKIYTIEQFYEKRVNAQLEEAVRIFRSYVNSYGRIPPRELFHEYFFLFEKIEFDLLPKEFKDKFYDHGNFDESRVFYQKHIPQFDSYEEFCAFASNQKSL